MRMANRKQFTGSMIADVELLALLKAARTRELTEEDLREQRISFAFGNAMNTDEITKDSVRRSSKALRLRA